MNYGTIVFWGLYLLGTFAVLKGSQSLAYALLAAFVVEHTIWLSWNLLRCTFTGFRESR